MKKYRYVHLMLFAVLFYGSTVSLSAQKFVDISGYFQVPPYSIFVDTTGYPSIESMPRDTVLERTYAKIFSLEVWKEHNPSKDVGGELPRCVTGTTMNTSTAQLQAAHDSASFYYPGSLWCEELRYQDFIGMTVQLETIEKQLIFAGRFNQICNTIFIWQITDPVSVEETQTQSLPDGFVVYPNPASTSMTFTSSVQSTGATKRLKIQLYDALGQHVADTEINDGESIDVSALGNGAYRAVISEGDRNTADVSVLQFIVNR